MMPVETILSGPAASVMGILVSAIFSTDSVVLDIGGTTTDIAVFASGALFIEPDGIALDGRATLVRALRTRSIGIGGDSLLRVKNGARRRGSRAARSVGRRRGVLGDTDRRFQLSWERQPRDVEASKKAIAELAKNPG